MNELGINRINIFEVLLRNFFVCYIGWTITTTILGIIFNSLAIVVFGLIFNIIFSFLLCTKHNKIIICYLIVFIIAIAAIVFWYYAAQSWYGIPYNAKDDEFLEGMAIQYSIGYLTTQYMEGYNFGSIFIRYLSIIYKFSELFGGYHTIVPRMINTYLLMGSILILEFISKKEFKFNINQVSVLILLAGLNSNVLFPNSFIYRDTLILFLLLTVYSTSITLNNINSLTILWKIPIIIFSIWCMLDIREMIGYISIIIVGITLIKNIYFSYFTVILISCLLLIGGKIGYLVNKLEWYLDVYQFVDSFVLSIPILPFGVFIRFIYGFFTPLPMFPFIFQGRYGLLFGIGMAFNGLWMIAQILFFPLIIKSVFKAHRLNYTFLLIFLSYIMVTFTFRHYLMFYGFLTILFINEWGKSTKLQKKISVIIMSVILGIGFLAFINKY